MDEEAVVVVVVAVVVVAAGEVPAEIAEPGNVRCETNFKTGANLPDELGIVVVVVVIISTDEDARAGEIDELIVVVVVIAPENHTGAREEVRRKPRAMEWIT